jgi:hypothetical protein
MRFFQCRLQQDYCTVVGWIEERGAIMGARVEIPECGGLWRVAAVYQPPIDAAWLRGKQRIDRKGMPSRNSI